MRLPGLTDEQIQEWLAGPKRVERDGAVVLRQVTQRGDPGRADGVRYLARVGWDGGKHVGG